MMGAKESFSIRATQQRKGSIKGRVVGEADQPFSNAVVYVSPVNGTYEERREVATDENGHFQVDGLAARPYVIDCFAEAYVRDYAEGEYHFPGEIVTIRLSKGGVITGTVTNSAGEPVVKAKVVTLRVRDKEGDRLPSPQEWSGAETDDRGIYRTYGLETGSYLLLVNKIGERDDRRLRNEVPIYYPSATHAGAQEVRVSRGEEVSGIDISYRNERGHIISGRCLGVSNDRSSDEVYMRLIHEGSRLPIESGWKGYKQKSSFAFYGVPDGEYILIAQNDPDEPSAASPPRRVVVRGRDIADIELTLVPFGSIGGRVVKDHSPNAELVPECKQLHEGSIEEIVIKAIRDDRNIPKWEPASFFDPVVESAPDEKGNFLLKNLAPGQFRIGVEPVNEGVYVQSILTRTTAGKSVDIARNSLSLKWGERISGVNILVREGAASIRGRVVATDDKIRLPARIHVYLVPSEREYADNVLRYSETVVQSDGAFVFKNIAPGRYWLLARPHPKGKATLAGWSAIREAMSRAALRREAESTGVLIDLQRCRRVTDYTISY